MNIAQLEEPSNTAQIMDGNAAGPSFYFLNTDAKPITPGPPRTFGTPVAIVERHLDTLNVLFADGHVKANRIDSLMLNSSGASCAVASGPVCSKFTVQAD